MGREARRNTHLNDSIISARKRGPRARAQGQLPSAALYPHCLLSTGPSRVFSGSPWALMPSHACVPGDGLTLRGGEEKREASAALFPLGESVGPSRMSGAPGCCQTSACCPSAVPRVRHWRWQGHEFASATLTDDHKLDATGLYCVTEAGNLKSWCLQDPAP